MCPPTQWASAPAARGKQYDSGTLAAIALAAKVSRLKQFGDQAGFRARQALVSGAAVGHREQAPDAAGDRVFGQRRVGELAGLLEQRLPVGDPPRTKDAIAGRIRRLLA